MTFRLTNFAFVCLMATANAVAATANIVADNAMIDNCYPTTPYPVALTELDQDGSQVFIDADGLELNNNQQARFFGNVQVSYSDTLLQAPQASFSQSEQIILADGGISYFSPALAVRSQKFVANLQQNRVELSQADYQLATQSGRGAADILLASETSLQLSDASFTACPIGDNSWALHANEIKLNADEGWGQAWHTVFKVRDIPVLYLPYLSFPITEERKSGLLLPNVGSSQRLGVDLELPYYFNLAENYDLTLTPRVMTNRGYQLKSEFRYLTEDHQGLLHLEYMQKDRERPELTQRYLGHYNQRSDFTPRWRGTLDVTDISDDAYLTDLGSDYMNQSDTQLLKQGNITYYGDDVFASLQLQDFTVLGNYDKAYAALPVVDVRSAEPIPLLAGLEFDWQAQYAYFRNDQALIHSAHRAHIEPTVRLPFISPAMEFMAEASLMHTRYQQNSDQLQQDQTQTIQRTMPKLRLRGQLNFERSLEQQGELKVQTFEPQLQYLYIPHRSQSEIGLFDTTRLQDDYFGLFRENRFSGLDRINEANQLTLGATSRIYDANDREQFRFSLGQIFFITSPTELQDPFQQSLTDIESMLAAESMWQWHRRWFVSAGVQYDSDNRNLIKSNVTLDYRGSDKTLFQLNHRYSQAVSDYEISQIGLLGTQPVADHWQLFGSYYYDLNHSQMMEAHFGIQYESCCWAIRLVARRQIATDLTRNPTDLNIPSTFDNGISLQFVLKGFGDKAGFAVTDMLSNGIFSYRRPYLLNN
ncbi:LPS assembly protein LptD [Alkalimonas collagenimarina]|uniref:LPS-assembly protein LptD n=1 Tax=Alkalimonas collagenimarina TaxID=400390 RepID=A0ABT9GYF9_9GAMM|nr:LPS assembly protein LptD [Alkalimonas collagenimarina]MDP4536092.1 LPS assembly protein LptD [Alkalimonas collagenimarina]